MTDKIEPSFISGELLQDYLAIRERKVPFVTYLDTTTTPVTRVVFETVPDYPKRMDLIRKLDGDTDVAVRKAFRSLMKECPDLDPDDAWCRSFRTVAIMILRTVANQVPDVGLGRYPIIQSPVIDFILWRLGQAKRFQPLADITPIEAGFAIITEDHEILDRAASGADLLRGDSSLLIKGWDEIVYNSPASPTTTMFLVVTNSQGVGVCYYTPFDKLKDLPPETVEEFSETFSKEISVFRDKTMELIGRGDGEKITYIETTATQTLWSLILAYCSEGAAYPNAVFVNTDVAVADTSQVGFVAMKSYLPVTPSNTMQ